MAVDASFAYDLRNRLGATADAAAKSAAFEIKRGNSGHIDDFARAEIERHQASNFIPAGVSRVVRLCNAVGATCTSPYNTARYVEVILSKTQNSFFASAIGFASLTPVARAVAGIAEGSDCWVIFNDLTTNNNDQITLDGCGVSVGHNITLDNNSWIHASEVGYGNTCSGCGNVTPTPRQSPVPADPLSMLNPPPNAGPNDPSCPSMRSLNGAVTLNPGTYCGWTFSNSPSNDVTLNAGIYYMTGPIHADNGGTKVNFHGSGVMIYLANGASIDLGATNDVHINVSAPTSGDYSGVVFYQDRANTAPANFAKNNGDFTFSGASYFPNASVTVKNNLAWTGDCVLFVAKDLTTKNNANVNNHCDAFPGSPLLTVSLAEYGVRLPGGWRFHQQRGLETPMPVPTTVRTRYRLYRLCGYSWASAVANVCWV